MSRLISCSYGIFVKAELENPAGSHKYRAAKYIIEKAIAAKNINGTILLPNEEFSYNKAVGPRTYERGFQDASGKCKSHPWAVRPRIFPVRDSAADRR